MAVGQAVAVEQMTPLSRNLIALERTHPDLAVLIGRADDVPLSEQEWARIGEDLHARDGGIFVVLGFGRGYHVANAMKAMGKHGYVIVYEPDLGRLRAAFSERDMPWLGLGNLRFCTDKDAIGNALAGCESLLASGVKVIEHPPSGARLDDGFLDALTNATKAMRTNLVTTCVLTEQITENVIANAAKFVVSPGILPLEGKYAGRPAVVVSAGPSLARNLHDLLVNGYEDRFVIIATQTVLKPMLAIGLRPHFVCAIDWCDISKRFYEGLTAEAVRGITLICQPSVSPAVPAAWPGAIRFCADQSMSDLLEEDTVKTHGMLTPGATVAHTCYYLARYMGCEPVILIGQDLGFTDGAYYGKGAAIHNVWQSELNEFGTLEMKEHERVMRGRQHSKKVPDVHGRPMFTDIAMLTYLEQFNAVFRADQAAGLTIIDATEGGARKQAVVEMTFRDALDKYDPGTKHGIGEPPPSWRVVSLEAEVKRAHRMKLAESAGRL